MSNKNNIAESLVPNDLTCGRDILPSRCGKSRKKNVRYTFVRVSRTAGFDAVLGVTKAARVAGKPNLLVGRKMISEAVKWATEVGLESLPPPGAKIGLLDCQDATLVAAAVIANRIEKRRVDPSLVERLINMGKSGSKGADNRMKLRIEVVKRIRFVKELTWENKIRVLCSVLDNTASEDNLVQRIETSKSDYQPKIPFAISEEPLPYKFVISTAKQVKPFHFGIEMTDVSLLKQGMLNLDHHGNKCGIVTLSACEQALYLPADLLPVRGSTGATVSPDADSVTAMAVLCNRIDGKAIDRKLVEAIGSRDRGTLTVPSDELLKDSFFALRSIARNERLRLGQRVALVREILAGTVAVEELQRISWRHQSAERMHLNRARARVKVVSVLPGKLALVSTPREFSYQARNIGLAEAPVVLVWQTDRKYFTVISAPRFKVGAQMREAMQELMRLEPGWVGRPHLFISPRSSILTKAQVLETLQRHLELS